MLRFTFLIISISLTHIYSFAQNVGVDIIVPLGKLHVKGTDNVSQLIIDANSTQGNINPLIKLRKSSGTDLMWIHSDDSSNVFMGLKTGRVNVIGSGGINNTSIGSYAGYSNTSGRDNTIIGARGSYFNSKGSMNTVIGSNALFTQAFGPGGDAWFPTRNVAIGYEPLYFNQPTNATNGVSNTAVGTGALRSNTSGYENTAHGTYALTSNITGSRNTALGYSAGVISGNLTNATAIGYNAKVDASNALVLGGTGLSSVNVGIGTTIPNARLEIIGELKVVDGTQGAGKILTSDSTGRASWQEPPPPSVSYPVVWICCNPWMTKNLDVSTYRNGDPIPNVTSNSEWATLTTGAYCYYNNDSTTYAATYGKLYNWYAVNDPRGLAPEGWHIPSDFEWTTLGACLGGDVVAGGPLKEIATTHWNTPNEGATNVSNFTALLGGSRVNFGPFGNIGYHGSWWSSTELSPNQAWNATLSYANDNLFRFYYDKRDGFSVRCLRD